MRNFNRTCLILAALLALLFCISLASAEEPTIVASGSMSGGNGETITWTLDGEGLATVNGSGTIRYSSDTAWDSAKPDFKKVMINSGVTGIGKYAFDGCSGLTEVVISSGVTSIDNYAFSECSGLTELVVPDSVTSIGGNAFVGCNSLTSITLPFVGSSATSSSAFGSIFGWAASGVTATDQNGFRYGIPRSLREVTITKATQIPAHAFENCSMLWHITIPDGVTSIGERTFYGCSGLKELVIPDGVTSIGDGALCGCSGLTELVIPDGVTSIPAGALRGCSSLTSIMLPFVGTSPTANEIFYEIFGFTGSSTVAGTIHLNDKYYYFPKTLREVTITKATQIPAKAFYHYSSLQRITILEGVTSIGDDAFYECSGLTELVIPDSVTSIGNSTFYGCSGLTELAIPDGVTSIGQYAFESCSGFTELVIPDSVTNIGDHAFSYCYSLTSITLPFIGSSAASNEVFGYVFNTSSFKSGAVEIKQNGQSYYIPKSLREVIITAATRIPAYAFENCKTLQHISIANNVTSIGNYAFRGCSGLTELAIPDGVTSIGDSTFYGCSGLTELAIPDGVTSIGQYAFKYCSGLTVSCGCMSYARSYSDNSGIPVSLQHYYVEGVCADCGWDVNAIDGGNCGDGGSIVTWMIFSNGKLTICGTGKMKDYSSNVAPWYNSYRDTITSVDIESGVTNIGQYTFSQCKSLASVTIPDSVASIGNYAFSGCTNLKYVMIPDTQNRLTSIGSSAFYNIHPKIYCYEYSFTESWAAQHSRSRDVVLMDGMDLTKVIGIGLPEQINIRPNESRQIIADIFPIQSSADIIWNSSDPGIVSVDGNGTVTAHTTGTATITASFGDISDSMQVVSKIPLEDLSFGREDYYVVAKESMMPEILPTPQNANYTLKWSTSDTFYATVDANGVVTGKAIGDATITATSDNNISRRFVVHICYPVTAIEFAETSAEIGVNETKQLTANVTARTQSFVNKLVTFASSDESVATVDENGLVTGVSAGIAEITAAYGDISASCSVSVVCAEHDWKEVEQHEPTCTEPGMKSGIRCSVCGAISSGCEEIEKLGHDIVSHDAQAATCTEIGWNAYDTCKRCDYTTYAEIPALDHDLVHHEAQTPTCTEIGWNAYDTCTRCDYTTYVEIPALGHIEVIDSELSPTRTTYGKTKGIHCGRCNEILLRQTVVAPLIDIPVLKLPSTLKAVECEAFMGSSIECVVLPDSCESIGSKAFADCDQLKLVEIPSGVSNIAADAFNNSPNVVIVTSANSEAEAFAKKHEITYVIMNE